MLKEDIIIEGNKASTETVTKLDFGGEGVPGRVLGKDERRATFLHYGMHLVVEVINAFQDRYPEANRGQIDAIAINSDDPRIEGYGENMVLRPETIRAVIIAQNIDRALRLQRAKKEAGSKRLSEKFPSAKTESGQIISFKEVTSHRAKASVSSLSVRRA